MGKSQEEKELDALQSLDKKDLGKVNKEEILNPKVIDARLSFLNTLEVDKSNMLYQGMFYPESWVFKTRAATGEEVVALSTINSEDPMSVDEGINEVLHACLKIEDTRTKQPVSVDRIYEFDRLWFLLFIRDHTMQNHENNISWKVGCQYCEEKELEVELSFDKLVQKEMTDVANKYFNSSTQTFEVKTKSYGVLKLQPTNLKRAQIFKDYLIECNEQRINPDKKFISLFPILINSENENDKDIINVLYTKYRNIIGDIKLFSLYKNLQEKLSVGIEQSIKSTCHKCRKEGVYEIQFPLGIHNIFVLPNIDSELL